MVYHPTEYSYKGKTYDYYIIYETNQRYRSGIKHPRKRAKRVYISGKLLKWKVGTFTLKTGRKAYGVQFEYENPRAGYHRRGYTRKGFTAHRGRTTYRVSKAKVSPAKIGKAVMTVKKVVPIPKNARHITVTRRKPPFLMNIT